MEFREFNDCLKRGELGGISVVIGDKGYYLNTIKETLNGYYGEDHVSVLDSDDKDGFSVLQAAEHVNMFGNKDVFIIREFTSLRKSEELESIILNADKLKNSIILFSSSKSAERMLKKNLLKY